MTAITLPDVDQTLIMSDRIILHTSQSDHASH